MNLKNSVVLITGGSSGIGEEIAYSFAREGAIVIINCEKNIKGAKNVLVKVKKYSPKSSLFVADVGNIDEVGNMFKYVIDNYGKIDILINNAAIPKDIEPFLSSSYESILEVVKTDLIGPMLCSKEAIKYMQKSNRGKIINTSSIRGWESGGRTEVYSASKAGINNLTKTMARNYGPNILVNAIAPGFVKTRNYDNVSAEMIGTFLDQTVIKDWVNIKELAETYIFLAKNDSITGQILYVDGGFTIK